MIRHAIVMVSASLFWGAAFFTVPAYADYRIILKNGETISVSNYEMDGDNIVFNKYGGLVSFSRSESLRSKKTLSKKIFRKKTLQRMMRMRPMILNSLQRIKCQRNPDRKAKTRRMIGRKDCGMPENSEDEKDSMDIYCWQAASAKVSAAPESSADESGESIGKTGKQFQDHVQSNVDAFKANSTCDYYKRKVAEQEKLCSGL